MTMQKVLSEGNVACLQFGLELVKVSEDYMEVPEAMLQTSYLGLRNTTNYTNILFLSPKQHDFLSQTRPGLTVQQDNKPFVQ